MVSQHRRQAATRWSVVLLLLLGVAACGVDIGGVEFGAPPRRVELPADLMLQCPGGPEDVALVTQDQQPELPAAATEADALAAVGAEPAGLPMEELRPVREEHDGTWFQLVEEGSRVMVARTIRYSDGTFGVDVYAYCVGLRD